MSLYKDVCILYNDLFQQSTQNKSFNFTPKSRDKILILKFCSNLKKIYKDHEINDTLLISYFEFQFSRYAGIITPHGRNSIMLNWIIGDKALKEWGKRNLKEKYIVRWKVRSEKIKLTLKSKKQKPSTPIIFRYLKKINPLEEQMKLKFLNKKAGFIFCRDMTTLYNPKSDICKNKCVYKDNCIKRLKNCFPKLYTLRIETINGKKD